MRMNLLVVSTELACLFRLNMSCGAIKIGSFAVDWNSRWSTIRGLWGNSGKVVTGGVRQLERSQRFLWLPSVHLLLPWL